MTARLNMVQSHFYTFSPLFWLITSCIALFFGFQTEDTVLFMCVVVALPLGATLLWREGEPPILFAMFFIQWLQVSSGVFRAALQGMDMVQSYQIPGVTKSTWLSLTALMVMAVTIHLVIRRIEGMKFSQVRDEIATLNIARVWMGYLATNFLVLSLGGMVWRFGGLAQLLLAMIGLKWVFYFVLAVIIIHRKRGFGYLIAATLFEVLVGFSSFFSEYRHVFFVLGLAIFTSSEKIRRANIVMVSLVFVSVLAISVFWSIIKIEYRDFMSQGTGHQVVLVSTAERYNKLVELISEIEAHEIPEGIEQLVDRIQYVEFFGHVVDYVPRYIPHTGGEITFAALRHITQPRLLFPEKAALTPDVIITEKYTGLDIIVQQGWHTEVPVGYMADFYIDFGIFGMLVSVILLGLMYAYQYRFFITQPRYLIFAYGCISVIMRTVSDIGTSTVKLLGGNITTFIAIALAFRFLVPSLYSLLQYSTTRQQRGLV